MVSPARGDRSSSISTTDDSQYRADRNKQQDKLSCHMVQSDSVLPSLSDAEVRVICVNREKIRIVHANNPASFYIQSGSDSLQRKLAAMAVFLKQLVDDLETVICKSLAV